MLEDLELYVNDNYIKNLIIEENGVKKISKDDLDKLLSKLNPPEKNFIMYIINKQKIKVEKITRVDRSPYVRDNNYGDIQTNDLQKIDEPVMSKIEYSETNELLSEDYSELDKYLETRFIPAYVLMKKRKKADGEIEYYPSIRLHHIMALKLSEAELKHVMDYLNKQNIRVGGKAATLDNEFENYDYVTTYKESALPLSVPSEVTLQKIKLYKQNGDKKLKEEIITDNVRLVPFIAYKYAISADIDQHELESYGYEALILSIDKFDVNYGCTFSTYAVSCIRCGILDGIQELSNGKRDRFYYDFVNAIGAVEKECGLTLAEAPELIDDVVELLVATGKIRNNKSDIEYARRKITSMTVGNISLEDEETIEELLDYGYLMDNHDYAEEAIKSLSKEAVEKLLDTLTEREAKVIRMAFGLDGEVAKTLSDISAELNITCERVRQIEAKALRKLRHPHRSRYLKDYITSYETDKFVR